MTEASDNFLVALAKKGDIEAYTCLFKKYTHKLGNIIYIHTNDSAHVNDLIQEVMLKVYLNLHYFKGDSQFSTWLYRITQNTIKNYYRTMSQRLDSEFYFIEEQYASWDNSPERQLILIEYQQRAERSIARLSKELRSCLLMYLLEGQTYEAIAKKMQCPIGTVRSRIYRARKLMLSYIENK
jgi:RNA polymerase sigma-70 factor (ECF subfamily)